MAPPSAVVSLLAAQSPADEMRTKLAPEDEADATVTRLTSHNTEQSQRGSNPCLHLERVVSYVRWMRASTVLPGQGGGLVQPVHSMRPSIAERMDKWMDNFAVPDASVSALSVLSNILLTSSTARLLGSSRERSRRA
jgi:hypothetical protein